MAVVSQTISVYQGGAQKGTPVLIEERSLTAVTGAQTFNVPTGAKQVRYVIIGTGGLSAGFPTSLLLRYNNDSTAGNYKWDDELISAIATPAESQHSQATLPQDTSALIAITGAAPATDISITVDTDVAVVSGVTRRYNAAGYTKGPADATTYLVNSGGIYNVTTGAITTQQIIFGASFTGIVRQIVTY